MFHKAINQSILVGLWLSTSVSSLLSVFGDGCQYYEKWRNGTCKNDGKMNMRNFGYFAKWRMEAVAADSQQLMAVAQICASVFQGSLEWHTANVKNIACNDRAGWTKFCNYHAVEIYIYKILTDVSMLMAMAITPSSSEITQETHCRCQKHRL